MPSCSCVFACYSARCMRACACVRACLLQCACAPLRASALQCVRVCPTSKCACVIASVTLRHDSDSVRAPPLFPPPAPGPGSANIPYTPARHPASGLTGSYGQRRVATASPPPPLLHRAVRRGRLAVGGRGGVASASSDHGQRSWPGSDEAITRTGRPGRVRVDCNHQCNGLACAKEYGHSTFCA
jgi:hypothetical protein